MGEQTAMQGCNRDGTTITGAGGKGLGSSPSLLLLTSNFYTMLYFKILDSKGQPIGVVECNQKEVERMRSKLTALSFQPISKEYFDNPPFKVLERKQ